MNQITHIPAHFDLCPDCKRRARGLEVIVTMADIKRAVAKATGISEMQLISDDKSRAVVHARWLAIALCKRLLGYGVAQIGRAFHKDHSVVTRACRKLQPSLDAIALSDDAALTEWVAALIRQAPRVNYIGNGAFLAARHKARRAP